MACAVHALPAVSRFILFLRSDCQERFRRYFALVDDDRIRSQPRYDRGFMDNLQTQQYNIP